MNFWGRIPVEGKLRNVHGGNIVEENLKFKDGLLIVLHLVVSFYSRSI